jgi:hypothetical protein
MNVLEGPRRELRRIVHGGHPQWAAASDDGTVAIRRVAFGGDWWTARDGERNAAQTTGAN